MLLTRVKEHRQGARSRFQVAQWMSLRSARVSLWCCVALPLGTASTWECGGQVQGIGCSEIPDQGRDSGLCDAPLLKKKKKQKHLYGLNLNLVRENCFPQTLSNPIWTCSTVNVSQTHRGQVLCVCDNDRVSVWLQNLALRLWWTSESCKSLLTNSFSDSP